MELSPRLIPVRVPRDPVGAVIVLHGGASRRDAVAVSPTQLSVLRMIPVARRISRLPGLAVYRVLNSRRGWDAEHTPVVDTQWALDRVRERLGELPIVLVGHSLGGRAAVLAGGADGVVGAVALAPYLLPGDGAVDLSGRRVLMVHGARDRIASLPRAEATARELARHADVGFIRVADGTHSMLRHHRDFDGAAAAFTAGLLLGRTVQGPVGRLLAGESVVEV